MSTPAVQPKLLNVSEATTITGASSISIYAVTGTVTVEANGTLTLPTGVGMTLQLDGDFMGAVIVTPASESSAIISYFG